nr:hypothetical protein [uncultured Mucilaginibacter sp.]
MINSPEERLFAYIGSCRGAFINQVAYIEKKMEFFVAYHFCRNIQRAHEMVEFLTGDRFVSFESKRMAFQYVLERHHGELYKKSKGKFESLTKIQNERNKLAHLIADTTPLAVDLFIKDGTFSLIKFSKDTKPVIYKTAYIKEITEIVDDVANWMNSTLREYLENNEAAS